VIYMLTLSFHPNADRNLNRFLHIYIFSTSYFHRIYLVGTMKIYPILHIILLLSEFLSKSNDAAKW
jgi:hypothetical protein